MNEARMYRLQAATTMVVVTCNFGAQDTDYAFAKTSQFDVLGMGNSGYCFEMDEYSVRGHTCPEEGCNVKWWQHENAYFLHSNTDSDYCRDGSEAWNNIPEHSVLLHCIRHLHYQLVVRRCFG